jgi:hypothetical protein
MSQKCAVLQLVTGAVIAVKERPHEVVDLIRLRVNRDTLVQLTRVDGRVEDPIWLRPSAVVSVQAGEVLAADEARAVWRARADQIVSGRPLS